MSGKIEFYHRHNKRLTDANLFAIVGAGIASHGFVVDRLKAVRARRLNRSYWHYIVPVSKVAA